MAEFRARLRGFFAGLESGYRWGLGFRHMVPDPAEQSGFERGRSIGHGLRRMTSR